MTWAERENRVTMGSVTRGTILALVTLWALCGTVPAAVVGDRVERRASPPAGVPLHQERRGTHDVQRVPEGTVATVMALAPKGRWLKRYVPDGRTGWMTAPYVRRTLAPASQPTPPPTTDVLRPDIPTASDDPERLVWSSPAGCRRVHDTGARLGRIGGTIHVRARGRHLCPRDDGQAGPMR
jgi:hypothetical protein